MIIGINLLWIKPNKSGGIESYIRNLLDGLMKYNKDNFKFILFVSKNNCYTFDKYFKCKNLQKSICNVNSLKVAKRIIWENLFLSRKCIKNNVSVLFTPVYSKPVINKKGIKYITTIHDLQALHYPEYFSLFKYLWLKFAWKRCAKTSDKIIAISKFVKNDIIEKLNISDTKIKVIYNPIVKSKVIEDFSTIKNKYNIAENKYFYTVSSMLPHKNLKTLLYVMKEIKEKNLDLPKKLVISGVGGKSENTVKILIKRLGIENSITITGFVSNEERDCLYKNANIFLFPSIFEGFGMPPIESLMSGTPVVTTKCTSIPEVTENKAIYVNDPVDVNDWIQKIWIGINKKQNKELFDRYCLENVSKAYLKEFINID